MAQVHKACLDLLPSEAIEQSIVLALMNSVTSDEDSLEVLQVSMNIKVKRRMP